MKAIPIKIVDCKQVQCEPDEATYLKINMPSIAKIQVIPVIIKGSRKNTPCWTWNGDTEKPTLKPSVLVQGYCGDEEKDFKCHSWVTDGEAQFLSDCTHELVNKTVGLLDVPLQVRC